MAKVLVLYYSAYGHIEQMANAVAEGAREAGAQVDVKRVPELVPDEVARNAHMKLDQLRARGQDRRARRLRRHPGRDRHPLRPHELADGQLPRPGGRACGCAAR